MTWSAIGLAWDTLVYFASPASPGRGLRTSWASSAWAAQVASSLPGRLIANLLAIIVLVSFFFLIHYLFASLTAHTMAVLPALLAARASRSPACPCAYSRCLLVYAIGLMGVITPYATGPAPVYFGSGFIPRRDFWILGFVFGVIYLTVLLGVGIPYLLTRAS